MNRNFVLLILGLGFCFAVNAQPAIEWQRQMSLDGASNAQSVAWLRDGGYVIAGPRWANEIFVSRYDSDGDTVWTHVYPGLHPSFTHIAQCVDSGFILTAMTNVRESDWVLTLVRLNDRGDTVWTHIYQTQPGSLSGGGPVLTLPGGGFLLGGWVGAYDSSGQGGLLIRTDGSGNAIWQRIYWMAGWNREVRQIAPLSGGGYGLAVYCQERSSMQCFAFVIKTDGLGNEQWNDNTLVPDDNWTECVAPAADGGFVAGVKVTQRRTFDMSRLMKYSSAGALQWTQEFTFPDRGFELKDLHATPDGGYMMAVQGYNGNIGSCIGYLLRVDSGGHIVWQQEMQSYAAWTGLAAVTICPDYRIAAAGFAGTDGAAGQHAWMVVTAPDSGSMAVYAPYPGSIHSVWDPDTVRWNSYGFAGNVRVEFNRDYPRGNWQTVFANIANSGWARVYYSEPAADHCRFRVTSLSSGMSGMTDDFVLRYPDSYLALVSPDVLDSEIVQWDASAECPAEINGFFRLRNLGNDRLEVFGISPLHNSGLHLLHECPDSVFLESGETLDCMILIQLAAAGSGEYRDTLRIRTNAHNRISGGISLPLHVSYAATPPAPQITIARSGNDAVLSWNPVTLSTQGCAISPTGYFVFMSPQVNQPFIYLDFTDHAEYVHASAFLHTPSQFYQVITHTGDLTALSRIRPGDSMERVLEVIKERP